MPYGRKKLLCITLFFHKINGYLQNYDGIKYLTLISYGEKCEKKN